MENWPGYLFLFLLLSGGSLIIQLVWFFAKRRLGGDIETLEQISEREQHTKLIRQWVRDQKHGGPLKGRPRPLTLDEEAGVLGKRAPHRRPR